MPAARVLHGDCLEVMPTLDADSVDAIVTDPPYGLSFMGRDWDHGIPGEHFWREALRVAKPGAHMLAFGGTRTYHRLACAIEDAGWEIRDCMGWLYGSGFPKSLNLDGERQGWGTALKPAWEPIILARKPLGGTVAANVQEHGTGALNIDGCRVKFASEDDKAAAAAAAEIRSKQTDRNFDGWGMRDQRLTAESYAAGAGGIGRWPANIVHDGSDEVLAVFPDEGGAVEYTNSAGELVRIEDEGSAARFFYCAKASKADRDEGLDGFGEVRRTDGREKDIENPRLRTTPRKNHHPTVKPTSLMRYLVRLITPPDGVVLDPFCGSGSTGKAAVVEGFGFIGIEMDAEYVEIARARIEHAAEQPRQGVLL